MQTLFFSGVKRFSTAAPGSQTFSKQVGNTSRSLWQTIITTLGLQAVLPIFPFQKKHAFQMTIRSRTDLIEETVRYVQRRIAEYFHPMDGLLMDIGLCLRESLANAIIHGNLEISPKLRDDSWEEFERTLLERQEQVELANRRVIIRCEMKPRYVKLEVEDEGSGFNAQHIATQSQEVVLETENEVDLDGLSSGGRGLVIITTFMDHVFWNPQGNCITMLKDIPQPK